MKNEVQVNFKDLIIYLLKQWKRYVIVGIIGAVLLCGFYAVKGNGNDYSDVLMEDQLKSLRALLTEEEAQEAEEAAKLYLMNAEHFAILKGYLTESILHNIEPTKTPTGKRVYCVNGASAYGDEDISDEVIASLNIFIKSDAVAEAIKEALDLDVDNAYIAELLTIESLEMSNSFTVVVLATDIQMCQQIMAKLDEMLEAQMKNLGTEFQNYSYQMVSEGYYIEMNPILQTLQFDLYNRLNNTKTLLGKGYYDLTPGQESYYDALLTEAELEKDETQQENSDENTPVASPSKSFSSYVKMAILGAFAGVFFAVVFALLKYLLTDSLKTKEDLSETFGQHVFAEVSKKEVSEGADVIALLKEDIKYAGSKHSVKTLLLAGSVSEEMTQLLKENLKAELSDESFRIETGVLDKNNKDSVKLVNSCDGVVCIEKIGMSSYTQIEKEIKLCEYYNVPLLGFVVIK